MVSKNQALLFYAHLSKDNKKQELNTHLIEVAEMSQKNASKIGMKNIGYCLGLLHDLGKYLELFQDYLSGERHDISRGDIDHSTAGAQYFNEFIKAPMQEDDNKLKNFLSELIELCCVSHHSGLIDMIDIYGKNNFNKRLSKKYYYKEVVSIEDVKKNIEKDIVDKINNVANNDLLFEIEQIKNKIDKNSENEIYRTFSYGMLARFLLSCLIDADYTNSADFERGIKVEKKDVNWNIISEKLEKEINELNDKNKSSQDIKKIRKQISDDCATAGQTYQKGCYKLEVPTGGGKTLASFRFAVEMAKKHNADRIIYCIPFTTIIEQNADTIRKIVETDKPDKGEIVLEHHSNISQTFNDTEEEFNPTELYMQSWDIPIIFTTNVQILNVLFGRKTTDTRKLHQLANSIIIFDEIQALPIKCVHLFNNAINYLVDFCNTAVVLCTATQPLLDNVDSERGCLKLSEKPDIIQNRNYVFDSLKRVEIKPEIKNIDYTSEEIASKAIEFVNDNENCLVICNTTKSAKEIFEIIKGKADYEVYHLSARMMPVHRKIVLRAIKRKLNKKEKIVVVSTQVIEAGIDIDFNCGIRALAGLDSIIQAAGRINRNGTLKNNEGNNKKGELYVYNFNENLDKLEYIWRGKETTKIILRRHPNADLLDNKIIKDYYDDFFYQKKQQKEMQYLICNGNTELDLLSENCKYNDKYNLTLNQSFKEASNNFRVIDDIASPVCIERKCVRKIIDKINSSSNFKERDKLIKGLHKYSVNIYPNQFKDSTAIKPINNDLDIYSISDCYYDKNFGITEEATLDKGGACV
ncbi:MAG: CRISPR-associated helicase Cas3' [Endomicrobium sp.]|jgi:CRISPR-associated endonuclease/helicase Cas3|nr:CRISPR-associated helicase Cas3' [Endomicrobium sp.]